MHAPAYVINKVPPVQKSAQQIPLVFSRPGSHTQKVSWELYSRPISTFNKCVLVILLFMPLCTEMSPSTLVPFKYIQYTKLHEHVLALGVHEARASTFWWDKWSLPIRNSILQHWGAMKVTVKTLLWLMLTEEPNRLHEYCPQLLQNWCPWVGIN